MISPVVSIADVYARALIASARVFGGDPVKACLAKGGPARQPIPAAIVGLTDALGGDGAAIATVFSTHLNAVRTAERRGGQLFKLAADAALCAVRGVAAPRVPRVGADRPSLPVAPAAAAPAAVALAGALRPKVILTAAAVRQRILVHLEPDNATAPDIAAALNVGEAQVRGALRDLAEAGLVCADQLTHEGWRLQFWRKVRSALP